MEKGYDVQIKQLNYIFYTLQLLYQAYLLETIFFYEYLNKQLLFDTNMF